MYLTKCYGEGDVYKMIISCCCCFIYLLLFLGKTAVIRVWIYIEGAWVERSRVNLNTERLCVSSEHGSNAVSALFTQLGLIR